MVDGWTDGGATVLYVTYLGVHLNSMLSMNGRGLDGVVAGRELVAFGLRLGLTLVVGDGEAKHAGGGGGGGGSSSSSHAAVAAVADGLRLRLDCELGLGTRVLKN